MSTAKTFYQEFSMGPRSYILLNSSPEEVVIEWGGETRRVPPRNQTTPNYGGHNPGSAKDADGDLIPGTITLLDLYDTDPELGRYLKWEARQAIIHKLGIDPETGAYKGDIGKRGISVLPPYPTKEQIREADLEGAKRYALWQVRMAFTTISSHEARNAARKNAGLNPFPDTPEYIEARRLVSATPTKLLYAMKGDLSNMLGDQNALALIMSVAPAALSELTPEDARAIPPQPETTPVAEPQPTLIDAKTFVDNLEKNPEIMKEFKRRFKLKKKYPPKPKAPQQEEVTPSAAE